MGEDIEKPTVGNVTSETVQPLVIEKKKFGGLFDRFRKRKPVEERPGIGGGAPRATAESQASEQVQHTKEKSINPTGGGNISTVDTHDKIAQLNQTRGEVMDTMAGVYEKAYMEQMGKNLQTGDEMKESVREAVKNLTPAQREAMIADIQKNDLKKQVMSPKPQEVPAEAKYGGGGGDSFGGGNKKDEAGEADVAGKVDEVDEAEKERQFNDQLRKDIATREAAASAEKRTGITPLRSNEHGRPGEQINAIMPETGLTLPVTVPESIVEGGRDAYVGFPIDSGDKHDPTNITFRIAIVTRSNDGKSIVAEPLKPDGMLGLLKEIVVSVDTPSLSPNIHIGGVKSGENPQYEVNKQKLNLQDVRGLAKNNGELTATDLNKFLAKAFRSQVWN